MIIKLIKNLRSKYYCFISKRKITTHGKLLTINAKCKFNNNVFLGDNVNFNGMEIKGKGKVVIGDNFHSGKEILFITSFHNYLGEKIPYDETLITKDIIIEDNVWLGDRVIVLGGVTIKEGAIVQAGSVVVSDVEKCAIVGGHPAKQFKTRDLNHYEEKKINKRYF